MDVRLTIGEDAPHEQLLDHSDRKVEVLGPVGHSDQIASKVHVHTGEGIGRTGDGWKPSSKV